MKWNILHNFFLYLLQIIVLLVSITSCNPTKHLKDNEYLLTKNIINLQLPKEVKNKGEIKDNLTRLQLQKPNSIAFLTQKPMRLWYYNLRYKKFHNKPIDSLPSSMEAPVVFDSNAINKTAINMKNYLFNLGYFYVKIKDTFILHKNKAEVIYNISSGSNYLINSINFNVPDSTISEILNKTKDESSIQPNKAYNIGLIDEERSRIVNVMRNNGYYHFTQDNIETFQLDTFNKSMFKHAENQFANANTYLEKLYHSTKPTADLKIIIQKGDDNTSFSKYFIGNVSVYADFKNYVDLYDSFLTQVTYNEIKFYFHNKYIHPKILRNNIFLAPGKLFSQHDYDKTYAKLNELGIFQYIKIDFVENKTNTLDCIIYMTPIKKYDFSTSTEASSGSTYDLGLSQTLNFHNKNFEKGSNLLTLSLNGGIEFTYDNKYGNYIINHFRLLTEYYGLNSTLDMPKFLFPADIFHFKDNNFPHTILTVGSNVIDRVNYFTLINTSANYIYNWHKSKTITWVFSPSFVNIIDLPYRTDSFNHRLDSIPFLKKSYEAHFIEGENITFIYNDIEKKHNKNYNYFKISLEEAGGLLGGINQLGFALNDLFKINYAQYTKLDFDLRHYFTLSKSTVAVRFIGGVGIPYGQSSTLPYIKQYFVGGPYSLRGWQIRALGPGSEPINLSNNLLDNTGDIKLEWNAEYRFLIAPLFAGGVKMNGAIFSDAGNIWLARRDSSYSGGNFQFKTLNQDIAIDVGGGFRFDIATFLTLRFDVAMPVKEPYVGTNDGWVYKKIDFKNSSWRSNNILINIAIGYPF